MALTCDMIDCDEQVDTDTDDVDEARRIAANKGWEYDADADEDICAEHEVKL